MERVAAVASILLLALPLLPQEKPKGDMEYDSLMFMSYTATLGILADTLFTYDAILNHNCYEANPLWRPLMDYPPLVMTLDMAISTGITVIADHLYKKDKKELAWALVLGANIVQGYFIYYHSQLRRDPRWRRD